MRFPGSKLQMWLYGVLKNRNESLYKETQILNGILIGIILEPLLLILASFRHAYGYSATVTSYVDNPKLSQTIKTFGDVTILYRDLNSMYI